MSARLRTRSRGVLGAWEAWAFGAGSVCFALAALPALAEAMGAVRTNVVFVVGSVFFTAGAALQQSGTGWSRRRSDPAQWWPALIQFAGTLFFNVSTTVALLAAISAGARGGTGWRPDVYGSVCFLVSSILAVRAARPGRTRTEAALNLFGSILFGISAIGAYVRPSSGDVFSAFWIEFGTFGGAVCFLVAAMVTARPRR